MGFYKPGANHPTDPSVARLHKAIWSLIYGGLLLLVLGLFAQPLLHWCQAAFPV